MPRDFRPGTVEEKGDGKEREIGGFGYGSGVSGGGGTLLPEGKEVLRFGDRKFRVAFRWRRGDLRDLVRSGEGSWWHLFDTRSDGGRLSWRLSPLFRSDLQRMGVPGRVPSTRSRNVKSGERRVCHGTKPHLSVRWNTGLDITSYLTRYDIVLLFWRKGLDGGPEKPTFLMKLSSSLTPSWEVPSKSSLSSPRDLTWIPGSIEVPDPEWLVERPSIYYGRVIKEGTTFRTCSREPGKVTQEKLTYEGKIQLLSTSRRTPPVCLPPGR